MVLNLWVLPSACKQLVWSGPQVDGRSYAIFTLAIKWIPAFPTFLHMHELNRSVVEQFSISVEP